METLTQGGARAPALACPGLFSDTLPGLSSGSSGLLAAALLQKCPTSSEAL